MICYEAMNKSKIGYSSSSKISFSSNEQIKKIILMNNIEIIPLVLLSPPR